MCILLIGTHIGNLRVKRKLTVVIFKRIFHTSNLHLLAAMSGWRSILESINLLWGSLEIFQDPQLIAWNTLREVPKETYMYNNKYMGGWVGR